MAEAQIPATMPRSLTDETLVRASRSLARRDRRLGRILRDHGPPPLWARGPGFATLIQIILEQQVSLASARAAYDRLRVAASPLTPDRFQKLTDTKLKRVGFSRQKTTYGRELARAILDGRLDLDAVGAMDDDEVRAILTRIKGIGRWTADIYLLLALGRPDVWPIADLALAVAAQRLKRLATCPSPAQLDRIGAAWKPWRSVAARLLWHDYLSRDR